MKHKKCLLRNKKGVSSLFVAIFATVLTVTLISTLFLGTSIFQSSLADSLRVEQKRLQEKILLTGPKGMNVSIDNPDIVEFLKVKNIGAITVRIKALYIAGKFICDPSELVGDSYIEPGDISWLDLTSVNPPVTLTDESLNGVWILVTERGTRSSETGVNILFGPPNGPPSANKFYFGPLMIIFDRFYWRSGTGSWHDGWEIPTETREVTWRILLSNVDDRVLNITDTSFFTLVGNENQQNKVLHWYIDPTLSSLRFEPGKYYFIYFTLKQAASDGGKLPADSQGITGLTKWTSCTNFLTFSGNFIEQDENPPFGQTIPFEAVLITE